MYLRRVFDLHEGHILGESINCNGKDGIIILSKYDLLTYEELQYIKQSYNSEYLIKVLDHNETKHIIYKNRVLVKIFIDDIMSNLPEFNMEPKQRKIYVWCINKLKEYLCINIDLLNLMIKLVNKHDYTFRHSINVMCYSVMIGAYLGLNSNKMASIVLGSFLHDIGKLDIDTSILDKPSKLNDHEFSLIAKHTNLGVLEIAKSNIDLDQNTIDIIIQHHEKLNGLGYPQGLYDTEINELSQIVSVADIFDALTSERAYHSAVTYKQALEIMQKMVSIYEINGKYLRILNKMIKDTYKSY